LGGFDRGAILVALVLMGTALAALLDTIAAALVPPS